MLILLLMYKCIIIIIIRRPIIIGQSNCPAISPQRRVHTQMRFKAKVYFVCPHCHFRHQDVRVLRRFVRTLLRLSTLLVLFHCMVRHGTVRYGSLLGGFPLGTVPGTFLVPPQPRFHAIRTVTKT